MRPPSVLGRKLLVYYALNYGTSQVLEKNLSPSRKVNQMDNRYTQSYSMFMLY